MFLRIRSIFSDLVVFPVLRIQAQYYGWRMAGYILAIFLTVLVTSALIERIRNPELTVLCVSNITGRARVLAWRSCRSV